MRHSIKGPILSGLVFPGLGQFVQRNYIRGTLMMLVVAMCLFRMLVKILRQVNELFEQIRESGIVISTDDITSVVIRLLPDAGGTSYRTLTIVLVLCWLVSTVDAFLVGLKMDAEENVPPPDLSDSVELERD